jgi:hypothetical protein
LFLPVALTSETDWQGLRALWAKSFRKLTQPVFDGLIRRLLNGESVYSISLWLHDVAPREARCGLSTWRRNVSHLRDHLKLHIERRKENALPNVAVQQEIISKFGKEREDQLALEALQRKPIEEIKRVVSRAMSELDAMMILKFAFLIQKERVDEMRELEKKIKMPMKGGYKEIEVMKSIGAEIAKIEMGNTLMRLKGAVPVPSFPSTDINPEKPKSKMVSAISKLSDVDRNLVRAAGTKIRQLILEVAGTEVTNSGLETSAGA